jgi:hypothetical protein
MILQQIIRVKNLKSIEKQFMIGSSIFEQLFVGTKNKNQKNYFLELLRWMSHISDQQESDERGEDEPEEKQ